MLLLVVPVIVVNAVERVTLRLLVIALSSALFIVVLSMLTKARTGEIFVAGATYVYLSISAMNVQADQVRIFRSQFHNSVSSVRGRQRTKQLEKQNRYYKKVVKL